MTKFSENKLQDQNKLSLLFTENPYFFILVLMSLVTYDYFYLSKVKITQNF